MRHTPHAFIFCCSMLLALTAATQVSADPNATRPVPNLNPQVQRNNVDSTVAWTDAVKESKDQLRKLLGKVILATPKPAIPYALSEDNVSDEVGAKAGMVKGTQRWVPIEAWGAREYQAGGDPATDLGELSESLGDEEDSGDSKFLEIQVALNGTRGLTSGLASKSDKPHLVEIEGAVAVQQTAIPIVDSTKVGRDDAEHKPEEPMTLLRLYFVDPDLATHVLKLQKETSSFPGFGPSQVLADHPDEVRSIVISFYGPKSDVEALARKVDLAALRKLLPG